jgi:hypothetical protein
MTTQVTKTDFNIPEADLIRAKERKYENANGGLVWR